MAAAEKFGADIRPRFPFFQAHPDLVYLDNAATTQKPKAVIDSLTDFYRSQNANIQRSTYALSVKANDAYEGVRNLVAQFLGCTPGQIAFTSGTTESINVVARSIKGMLGPDDQILVTVGEHHANFVPWLRLCEDTGAKLVSLSLDQNGKLDLRRLAKALTKRTKILAISHISNATGVTNPVSEISEIAAKKGIPVLIDAAQSAAWHSYDLKALKCDFLAFSGHKMFGPLGVGVLYASERFKDDLNPLSVGGGAIEEVRVESYRRLPFPHGMEAGTRSIGDVIGFGEAIRFIKGLDRKAALAYIDGLEQQLRDGLQSLGFSVLGEGSASGIVSFYDEDIHPHDLSSFLDQDGIAVRAGLHCTQPLFAHLQLPGTVRASISIYNTADEIDQLLASLRDIKRKWHG